jgi:predicted molibdopterin-dependent oxidoreductase YjgC
MQRTTIVFSVIVGIAAAMAVLARFGPGKITLVTGLIGSEKAPYFADVRVQKALTRHGLQVIVRTARSHELASRSDLKSHVSDMSYG